MTLAAYGATLGAWFHPIDDALHIAGVVDGVYPSPHLRPAHFAWNRALMWAFGLDAGAWHAASLALHAVTAVLVGTIARRVGLSRSSSVVATAVFASLYAPNEVVAWVAAACGLLSVFFVALCGCAWIGYLSARGSGVRSWIWYAVAVAALVAATASKEDSVLAGPLLFGIQVVREGWRSSLTPRSLAAYVPFAVVGGLYLSLAFDPSLWADRPGVGGYAFTWGLVPRAAANLAVLPYPRRVPMDDAPGWMLWAGLALIVGVLAVGLRARSDEARQSPRALALGLVLALFGLLPVLPGPWGAVAASRYSYPSVVGVALMAAACFHWGVSGRSFVPRAAVFLMALGWVALHTWSVRSTLAWRFVRPSVEFQNLVEQTFETLEASPRAAVLFVAPPLWNPLDHERSAVAFGEPGRIHSERVELDVADLHAELSEWSERGSVVVWLDDGWTPVPLDHTELHGAVLDAARSAASDNEVHGSLGAVPATWMERRPR
ncbi:hypothetical protein [Planctomycetes bacterium Pla163]|uniref:hypothetical protein n=1 Tax=Rohdeia mirabilis TaxID=2528008 RepID=UPI0011A52045